MEKISSNHSTPSNSSGDHIRGILSLLGEGVVLVPVYWLTKKPVGKSWQRRTLDSMKDPVYLRSFAGRNIGVLLGKASKGLCTIDFDADTGVEPFLARNPRLRDTTRTRRVRGCNFWVYVDGQFPASTKLKVDGREIGEWRADGNQTVIWGRAIDKSKDETEPTEYKFLNEVSPIHIRFDEIVFPDGVVFPEQQAGDRAPIRLNSESCVTESLHYCIPASLHNTDGSPSVRANSSQPPPARHLDSAAILANINARKEAQHELAAKHPNLVRLYTDIIEPRFQARPHARNDFIVKAVPFLYRAVAAALVLELVGCFYDCNRSLFDDSREQHMKEAEAMLKSVAKTYAESLSADERGIYSALTEHEQEAFRICRDLALLPESERPLLTFFLSFNHLADRLGIYAMQAQRIMRQLEIYGLVEMLKKGTRRAVGVRGEAGTYRWLLAPPQQTND